MSPTYFGLNKVVESLLGDYNADVKNTNSRTPLSWAAGNRHKAIVKLLLSTEQVDSDSKYVIYGANTAMANSR
ncbi:hypothetical protein F4823DRAFT_596993 [Ustulina deusta]|nr:hypothetical protein F4823DRAFT_596993 [Ustulina deusta]